jgi:NCAIR mutase (PurE)-related protein
VEADQIRKLLENIKEGTTSVDEAMESLKTLPYEDIGYAQIDHHRSLRKGFPEVVLGSDKTSDQIVGIVERLEAHGANILVTRVDDAKAHKVTKRLPRVKYDPISRTIIRINKEPPRRGIGSILVVTAGTSDIPVAEEAVITAELMGNKVDKLFDVGVAGIHRLLSKSSLINKATVIIVVAGMEGALASVVGGITDKPVIAVPTSIGYGASFGGLSALLGMLNSCAPGVAVVNIDNGFGAAFMASLINHCVSTEK